MTKHHGGTLEDHIDLADWSVDGDVITVYFTVITAKRPGRIKTKQPYAAEWELEPGEGQDITADDVKKMIAEQLKLPFDKRTWDYPDIQIDSMDPQNF